MFIHRLAGIEENTGADGQVLQRLKGKDSARWFAVVKQVQFIEFQIVHGQAMDIGGVEGEVDLIDRDAQAVGCSALCRGSICLRYPATRVDQEAKDEQAADDPGLTHDRKLSQV